MSRLEVRRLEKAKSRLGDVVLDPAQWPLLMEDICAAVGTTGAALLQSDVRTPGVPMTRSVVEIFKNYFETSLHVADIRAARGVPLFLSGQRVIRDQDLFRSEDIMMRDPLYATLSQFGFRWWSAIAFRSGPALWAMSLQRRVQEGMFEDHEIQVLSSLSDSLTQVATLSKVVGRQVLLGCLSGFEMVREPAISITATGRVLEINRDAAALFDSDVRVRNNLLHLRDRQAADALDRLLARARVDSDLRLSLDNPSNKVIVARRNGRRPVLLKLLPIHCAASAPFIGARFIVTFRDLDVARRAPAETLLDIFSLTTAEAKVASLIADGLSPEQIADELQLSRETVRNQIKAVFGKTGTHRQNELAALILRIQS